MTRSLPLTISALFLLASSTLGKDAGDLLSQYLDNPGRAVSTEILGFVEILAVQYDPKPRGDWEQTGTIRLKTIEAVGGELPKEFEVEFHKREANAPDAWTWDFAVLKKGNRLLGFFEHWKTRWAVRQDGKINVINNPKGIEPELLKRTQTLFKSDLLASDGNDPAESPATPDGQAENDASLPANLVREPPWGTPVGGLQCRILPEIQTVVVPEGQKPEDLNIRLIYQLRNVSQKPVRYLRWRYSAERPSDCFYQCQYRCTGPDGTPAEYVGKHAHADPLRPNTFAHISPAGPHNSLQWHLFPLPYDLTKPGRYELQVRSRPEWLQDAISLYYDGNAQRIRENRDNVWSGAITSNRVTIEVVRAYPPEPPELDRQLTARIRVPAGTKVVNGGFGCLLELFNTGNTPVGVCVNYRTSRSTWSGCCQVNLFPDVWRTGMFLVETISEYIAMIPPQQRTLLPFQVHPSQDGTFKLTASYGFGFKDNARRLNLWPGTATAPPLMLKISDQGVSVVEPTGTEGEKRAPNEKKAGPPNPPSRTAAEQPAEPESQQSKDR